MSDQTTMNVTKLGRTGLEVSVVGLGCGGHSRLGQGTGSSEAQSQAVVEAAIDMGITFIDTAAVYYTEEIVGRAIANTSRDKLVISSKEQIVREGTSALGDELISGDEYRARVEASLKRLNTDYIDIMHLHGVMPSQYDHCRKELVPVLMDLKAEGKIRFLGITERFIYDTTHEMLSRSMQDDFWDITMIGYNLINPSARHKIFPVTQPKGIATLGMFAVRRALSNPQALQALIKQLGQDGVLDASKFDMENPLGFLVSDGGAESVVDGAYRFCRHTDGLDIILTGTGNIAHLEENVASINRGPLSDTCLQQLDALFGQIDSVSGE